MTFSRCLLALTLTASVPLLAHAADTGSESETLQSGEYLAKAADCAACHRAPDASGESYSGGYAINSPMGDIIASNITPSKEHGIGNYTELQFKRAMQDGIRADGEYLYPAMPYTSYRGLTDDDIHALYVYFMEEVEPVDNAVPDTDLSFPYNLRMLMGPWNLLFLKDHDAPEPEQSDAITRGRYLVDALGHCGSCHTPRNALMAEKDDQYLAGAIVDGWHAPNITSDASGIGHWSEDELVQYLRTGHVANKAQAAGGMAEAVEYSLRYLKDADLQSIAAYLQQVPPIRNGQALDVSSATKTTPQASATAFEPVRVNSPEALTQSDSTNGQRLYTAACASCHQLHGQGTQDHFYPSLIKNASTQGDNANNLVMAILRGVDRQIDDYTVAMPAFDDQLNDQQIAAVSNYVLTQFGNDEQSVDATQVAELRNGAPAPWLIRATPWLLGLAVIVILFGIVLLVRVLQRRGK